MNLEDVIEGLNRYIEEQRVKINLPPVSYLVLQKSLMPTEKFKAYKKYEVIVWVKGNNRTDKLYIYSSVDRIITDYEDIHIANHNIIVVKELFELVNSEIFKTILDGSYRE